MRTTIKSKKTGSIFKFWAPTNGGYVRLETAGREGTLGQQICHGGGFLGETVSCMPSNFEQVCRKWYRQMHKAVTQRGGYISERIKNETNHR